MIQNVIPVIVRELNSYLGLRFGFNEQKVIISNLVGQDGSIAFKDENKVVCSLINIEQERVNLNAHFMKNAKTNPPVNLNLYLLFSAYFSSANYEEAFKFLTSVISFFQGKQVFTPSNTPLLDKNVDKITFEIVNLDLRELSNLWAALGAKYMPSVIYKLRMISIYEDMIIEEIPEITAVDTSGAPLKP
jgi:hypothetical protein